MTEIHPTALVEPGAELETGVRVGPYCTVGPHVRIGAGTVLESHVVLKGRTTLGENNRVSPFACLGGDPQDLKFGGEPSELVIGDGNTIRESVTMNIGTEAGRMKTVVGNDGYFMAYAHVAHDCLIGNQVILANSVGVAGHVEIGDFAILGGLAGVHQYCRIGEHAFIAGGAKVCQDVPHFCIAHGDRAQLVGVNSVGLRRRGWAPARLKPVRAAFRALFMSRRARLTALEDVEGSLGKDSADVAQIIAFVRGSKRGVCAARPQGTATDLSDDET